MSTSAAVLPLNWWNKIQSSQLFNCVDAFFWLTTCQTRLTDLFVTSRPSAAGLESIDLWHRRRYTATTSSIYQTVSSSSHSTGEPYLSHKAKNKTHPTAPCWPLSKSAVSYASWTFMTFHWTWCRKPKRSCTFGPCTCTGIDLPVFTSRIHCTVPELLLNLTQCAMRIQYSTIHVLRFSNCIYLRQVY